jgi:hypothetical protein
MRWILVCALAIAGAACSTPPPEGGNHGSSAVVCSREAPTGSFINVTRCRTQEQIASEREASKARAEDMTRAKPMTAPSTQSGR